MSTERLLHYAEHTSKEEQRSRLALNGGLNDYPRSRVRNWPILTVGI